MAETNNAVMINVSKDIIDAHVKAAVQQVLNRDPEALVRAVVDAAMKEPDRNSYGRSTIWETELNSAIRAVANETFKQWLDEQKPIIAKQVRAHFEGAKGKETVKNIVEQMTSALNRFSVHVNLGER